MEVVDGVAFLLNRNPFLEGVVLLGEDPILCFGIPSYRMEVLVVVGHVHQEAVALLVHHSTSVEEQALEVDYSIERCQSCCQHLTWMWMVVEVVVNLQMMKVGNQVVVHSFDGKQAFQVMVGVQT